MRKLKFVSELRAKKDYYWLIRHSYTNLLIHLTNLEQHLEYTKDMQQVIEELAYNQSPQIGQNYMQYLAQEIKFIKRQRIPYYESSLKTYGKLAKIKISIG
ncbi:hypothetical protein [Corynebacterium pseudokroppenstedtii]|uniref:hypothetical protein n=1 Tax=Corynebacterium pseudokroppenstedtii TaxID=2804917 RepID=UPI001F201102|nr:hypothetical protein [Corynebacterium pseudokroppenstedtii]